MEWREGGKEAARERGRKLSKVESRWTSPEPKEGTMLLGDKTFKGSSAVLSDLRLRVARVTHGIQGTLQGCRVWGMGRQGPECVS